jgi:hypothetical protein
LIAGEVITDYIPQVIVFSLVERSVAVYRSRFGSAGYPEFTELSFVGRVSPLYRLFTKLISAFLGVRGASHDEPPALHGGFATITGILNTS